MGRKINRALHIVALCVALQAHLRPSLSKPFYRLLVLRVLNLLQLTNRICCIGNFGKFGIRAHMLYFALWFQLGFGSALLIRVLSRHLILFEKMELR